MLDKINLERHSCVTISLSLCKERAMLIYDEKSHGYTRDKPKFNCLIWCKEYTNRRLSCKGRRWL